MTSWHNLNTTAPLPEANATSFNVFTPPKTDAWRASRSHDVFDAPVVYQVVPKAAFKSLRVTVTGPWKTQFDQGGFMVVFPSAKNSTSKQQWIKAGIEYFEGEPKIGVVGTDRFSDWSLCPMPAGAGSEATLEAVKEDTTLWVYLIDQEGRRQPLREVKWAFLGDDEGNGDDMWVGVYAAKPTAEAEGDDTGIEVSFKDFKIERSD